MTTITVYDDSAKILEKMADEQDTTVAEIVEAMIIDNEVHCKPVELGERR